MDPGPNHEPQVQAHPVDHTKASPKLAAREVKWHIPGLGRRWDSGSEGAFFYGRVGGWEEKKNEKRTGNNFLILRWGHWPRDVYYLIYNS